MKYPKTLYRFRPTGNFLSYTLRELYGDLWCAYPNTLNDPFDGFNTAKKEGDFSLKTFTSGIKVRTRGMKNWGVACFTQDWDNASMWAHYANNYTGICIGYSTEALRDISERLNQEQDPKLDSKLLKVKYPPQLPKEYSDDYEALRTKSIIWKAENEWRLITQRFNRLHENKVKGSIINTMLLTKKKVITEIMYGYRTDFATKKLLWGLNETIHQEVPIMCVVPNEDKTGLTREI